MWYMLYTTEHFSTIKKSTIMPFTATRMDLETVILSEISQTRQIHNTAYMWNLKKKNGTHEFIYKTETESQMQKINLWLPAGEAGVLERDTLGDWD